MKKYKVIMLWPDGDEEELEFLFDTYEEAAECAGDQAGAYYTGQEMFYLSNPGDYPLDEDEEVDWRIVEVDY